MSKVKTFVMQSAPSLCKGLNFTVDTAEPSMARPGTDPSKLIADTTLQPAEQNCSIDKAH